MGNLLALAPISPLLPTALCAHPLENSVQNIRTDSFTVFVMSNDFAQSHSAPHCKLVSVPAGIGPKSPPESLDNPAAFHNGTHSGLYRDRRSYNLSEDHSFAKARFLGEIWPQAQYRS